MAFQRGSIKILAPLMGAALMLALAGGAAHSQITGEIGENVEVGPKLPDMSFFAAEDVSLRVDFDR